jgi:hypothetical protein
MARRLGVLNLTDAKPGDLCAGAVEIGGERLCSL